MSDDRSDRAPVQAVVAHQRARAVAAEAEVARLARQVQRADMRVAVMQREIAWEAGLDADGTWMRRIVSPWEPDPDRPEKAWDAEGKRPEQNP